MDNLRNILERRAAPEEPEESILLKHYVFEHYGIKPQIQLGERHIMLVVPNAALANTIRYEVETIKIVCKITRKLHIRIG